MNYDAQICPHIKYKLFKHKDDDNTLVIFLDELMWMDYDSKYGLSCRSR